jgi:hypothetical protein
MTKVVGTKHPEYLHYEKGWRGTFCNRLIREGGQERHDKAMAERKEIKAELNCTEDRSWTELCDRYPPLASKEKPKSKPGNMNAEAASVLANVEIADPPIQMTLYDQALWALDHNGVRFEGKLIAPTAGARAMLQLAIEDNGGFLKFFATQEKQVLRVEGKNWGKDDDDELAGTLERSLQAIRKDTASQRAGLCPSCAGRSGGEPAVPAGADPPVQC